MNIDAGLIIQNLPWTWTHINLVSPLITLGREAFVSSLVHSPRLSFDGLLGMEYERLRNYFVPYDSKSGFDLYFKVHGHIAQDHIPPLISHFLFALDLTFNVGKIF